MKLRPRSTFRLPDGWSEPAVVEDTIVADGVRIHRAGLSSVSPGGEEVTSSAAEAGTSPAERCRFELLERVCTMEALRAPPLFCELEDAAGELVGFCPGAEAFPESDEPARWRYARSNGVALHAGWSSACSRAMWELCERDRVLRAWYGETVPERLTEAACASVLTTARSFSFRAYAFPEPEGGRWSRGVHVAGVFGFPRRPGVPLVYGYGARDDLASAVEAAEREALQLLAFLWGEDIPAEVPQVAPTPLYHLERFLCPKSHDLLLRWLEGDHVRHRAGRRQIAPTDDRVAFVDLTPSWLGGGLRVAKAISCDAAPLAFGEAPFSAHLPPELRSHPIA
jgi:hypothetical protein